MQHKLCFLHCVAKTDGEDVTSSDDCRSREVIAESPLKIGAPGEPVRQGGRSWDSRTGGPQARWREKGAYLGTSSGQGESLIRHWEVLSDEKVMGILLLGMVG